MRCRRRSNGRSQREIALLFELRFDVGEQRIDVKEVRVFRRARPQLDAELTAGGHNRHGQVAVDVRVHAREGELDGGDATLRTGSEERSPGRRRGARASRVGIDGSEEQAGKDEVEPLEKAWIRERALLEAVLYVLGHLPVEADEAGDAIAARQRALDCAQASYDFRNARRKRRAALVQGDDSSTRPPRRQRAVS